MPQIYFSRGFNHRIMVSADLCQLFQRTKRKKIDQECLTIVKSEAATSKALFFTYKVKKITKPQGTGKIQKIQDQSLQKKFNVFFFNHRNA